MWKCIEVTYHGLGGHELDNSSVAGLDELG